MGNRRATQDEIDADKAVAARVKAGEFSSVEEAMAAIQQAILNQAGAGMSGQ